MYTRDEFAQWWDQLVPDRPVDGTDHPLWIPENEITPGEPSLWFVQANTPLAESTESREQFWAWCERTLTGPARCYMVNESEEWAWWGFTNQRDCLMFTLRWA